MKKLIICFVVATLGASSTVALSSQEIEDALTRQVVQTWAYAEPIPELSAAQRKEFPDQLERAAYEMRNNDEGYLNPYYLGWALADSVGHAVQVRGGNHAASNKEQQRAVYYALNKLLPQRYLGGVPSFEEYSKVYPVEDWDAFRRAAKDAQELIYQAVTAIAEQQREVYKVLWLKPLMSYRGRPEMKVSF